MSSWVCAFTENGTSWIAASRLVAVTMIASSSTCANAGVANMTMAIAAADSSFVRLDKVPSHACAP
jgi:hypothetical protein